MENYEDLLRRKYLLGTPKEQYEWVEALVQRNAKLEGAVSNLMRTLINIKDTFSDGHGLRTIAEATIQVTENVLKRKQQFNEEDCAVCGSGGAHLKGCIYNDNL